MKSELYDKHGTQLNEYHEKSSEDVVNVVHTGFIAQEVEQAARETGFDFSGVDKPKSNDDYYGLRYAEFVVPVIKAMQEQQAMIQSLKAEIEALKSSNEALRLTVNNLNSK